MVSLFGVRCLLLVVHGVLIVCRCLLFVACCQSWLGVVCRCVSAVCCSLVDGCCLSSVCCLLCVLGASLMIGCSAFAVVVCCCVGV